MANKILVGIALGGTKPVIQMSDDQRPAMQLRQCSEQGDAVRHTGNRDDQTGEGRHSFAKEALDGIQEWTAAFHGWTPAKNWYTWTSAISDASQKRTFYHTTRTFPFRSDGPHLAMADLVPVPSHHPLCLCLGDLLDRPVSVSGAYAWEAYDDSRRADGNHGHTTIDFGGQWLMGAMLIQGDGPHLYHRNHQRQALPPRLPYEDEVPNEQRPKQSRDSDQEKGKRRHRQIDELVHGPRRRGGGHTIGSCLLPLAGTNALDR